MTMAGNRLVRAAGKLGVLIGLGATIASAADSTPQEILQARGLVQDGKYFLLPKEENEVKLQLNKVLPLVDELDLLFNQWAANEQKKFMVAAMNDELVAVDAQLANARAMLGQINARDPLANAKRQEINQGLAMLRQYYNQVQSNRDQVRNSIAGPVIQQQHLDKVAKAREVFLKAYDEMMPSADKLVAAYTAAARDDKVANALKVLRQAKSVQMKLGPSEDLKQAMTRVKNAKEVMNPQYFKPKPYSKQKINKVTTKGGSRK
jgi:hypothetical protein